MLVDAQLDAFQCEELKICFDPLDVPPAQAFHLTSQFKIAPDMRIA